MYPDVFRRGIYEWTSKTNGLDTKSKELQDIGSVADTTISVDLNLVEEIWISLVDLKSDLEGRWSAIQLTTSVVREDDGLGTGLDSGLGILDGHDTLGDEREAGEVLESTELVPGDEGVGSVTFPNISHRSSTLETCER